LVSHASHSDPEVTEIPVWIDLFDVSSDRSLDECLGGWVFVIDETNPKVLPSLFGNTANAPKG
jgi:hypothetical protein